MSEPKKTRTHKPRPKKVPLGEEEVKVIQEDEYSVSADAYQSRAVNWWSHGHIARGGITMLDGDPGSGKTALICDIAARMTRGQRWPFAGRTDYVNPQHVLIISEAPPDYVLIPRLLACGADMARVRFWGRSPDTPYSPPQLPGCLRQLEKSIQALHAGMVVFDTVSSSMTNEGTTGEQPIRAAMDPLSGICHKYYLLCLCTRHLTKQTGQSAAYRGMGGMPMLGTAQMGLLLTAHPTDKTKRILSVSKPGIGPAAPPRELTLVGDGDGVKIEWGEPVEISQEELLRGELERGHRDAVEDARRFLRAYLDEGPRSAADCIKDAEEAGSKLATLRIAKASLNITSYLRWEGGQRRWDWHPPANGWPDGLTWTKPE